MKRSAVGPADSLAGEASELQKGLNIASIVRMIELNSRQRKTLEKYANAVQVTVIIGQNGLTAAIESKAAAELDAHELIKVKFNAFKEEKRELTDSLCKATDAVCVRVIGNVAILYKPNPEPEKRNIQL